MMEADWDEVSRIAVPPPSPHVLPTIATAIAFDDLQELLWAGNEYVRIEYGMLNIPRANMELSRDESLLFTDPSFKGTPQYERIRCQKALYGNSCSMKKACYLYRQEVFIWSHAEA